MSAGTTSSVLDPLSSSTLNKLHEAAQRPTKKRKTSHESTLGYLATRSIVIRAHAASLSDEPLVLEPIVALPRSRLPLSWLEDASSSHSDAQPRSLFVADIPALETDLRARVEPTVLAVRLVVSGGLYIVERVKRGIYSLSRLARWVHEGDIVVAVKGWDGCREVDMDGAVDEELCPIENGVDWWQVAQIDEPLSELVLGEKSPGLDIAMVFGPSEASASSEEPSFVDVLEHRSQCLVPVSMGCDTEIGGSFEALDSQGAGDSVEIMDVDRSFNVHDAEVQHSADQLLGGMRDHYLQALYVSKTSVAYFAKGPLARCRAAFQSLGPEQSLLPTDLIAFYREAILAAKKMDLKYRETLPSAVRDAVLAVSDGEDAAAPNKRKSKKKKLGKNGLYPEEDGFIRKWWKDRNTNETLSRETSREAETKRYISDLRLRETQLQILLVLEVIALESSSEKSKANSDKDGANGENETSKKPKAKKPQDLSMLLELHLDRLCIWHAVSLEETTAADTAKVSSFQSGHMSGKKVESDAVRDFCTEVIIPFYSARLPDKCKLITRKFGVSGGISPAAKKTHSSAPKPPSRVEPGSEVKRHQQPAPQSRRSLQRVLTDERAAAASHNRHPSLNRSKTAPTQQDVKRDSIEPLLPTLLGGSVRGGIQKAKRAENREVDLNAVARQHETKLKRVQMLVDQKKELDAAILALRKPNREMVAKDIAEDAAKRVSGSGGSSRKSKNPMRNPFAEDVQVMATPRGNRKKDAVVGLPPLPRNLAPSRSFAGEMEDTPLPDSSPVMIPSSGRRATTFSGADSNPFVVSGRALNEKGGSLARQSDIGSIQETPSRPPAKLFLGGGGSSNTTPFNQPSTASAKGNGLFRVPNLPAPRSTPKTTAAQQIAAPSTPVSSRRKGMVTSSQMEKSPDYTRSSMVTETPPKQQRDSDSGSSLSISMGKQVSGNKSRASSSPAVTSSPVKGAAAMPATPEKSQSIYQHLGWDDDEMDL